MTPAKETKPLITFWGTRGSISTPGRITEKYGGNTPCVTVTYEDIYVILDAGTGMRQVLLEKGFKPGEYENSGTPLTQTLLTSIDWYLDFNPWDT